VNHISICTDRLGVSEAILVGFGVLLACGAMLVGTGILKRLGLEHDPRMPSVGRRQRLVVALLGLVAGSTVAFILMVALLNAKPCGPKGEDSLQRTGRVHPLGP